MATVLTMASLPSGVICPEHDDISRFHVVRETDEEWLIQVDCIECAVHGGNMPKITIKKKKVTVN